MVGKAAGLKPRGLLMRTISSLAWRYWRFRNWKLARAAI